MPFVVPRVVGYEEGKSWILLREQHRPTEDDLTAYIGWLETELVLAKKAHEELFKPEGVPDGS